MSRMRRSRRRCQQEPTLTLLGPACSQLAEQLLALPRSAHHYAAGDNFLPAEQDRRKVSCRDHRAYSVHTALSHPPTARQCVPSRGQQQQPSRRGISPASGITYAVPALILRCVRASRPRHRQARAATGRRYHAAYVL